MTKVFVKRFGMCKLCCQNGISHLQTGWCKGSNSQFYDLRLIIEGDDDKMPSIIEQAEKIVKR